MDSHDTPDTRTFRFQGLRLTWYGHAAFQLQSSQGKSIFIDPWLDNPNSPVDASEISDIDFIALTHGHADHIGNTLELARQSGAPVIGIFEIAQYLVSRGLNDDQAVGMNIGGTFTSDGVQFSMVPALHSSGIAGENGVIDGGAPAGFVIEFENGYSVYHTGDTDLFSDMQYIREFYQPNLMLACIGDHFTMGPRKAARSIELIQPEYVIPMHYGTFPLLTGTPEALIEAAAEEYKQSVIVAEPGEIVS
ncbi:MAG TPA: metal-dependent hydrolase [bacterium]|nr:metal-dependent hydrolase [bacterium]